MEKAFSCQQTGAVLRDLAADHQLEADPSKQRFTAADATGRPILHVQVPPLQPIAANQGLEDYLVTLTTDEDMLEGFTLVVLLQAGASALGLWEDGELILHKAFKRYVIRGKGKAQPTHLKTKGKSRYGSRLRLQQARRLLEETNERMHEWTEEHDAIERCYYAAPIRLWSDLFEADPAPPFLMDRFQRIPRDFDVPDHAELKRAFAELARGRVVEVQGA